jgi:hypothetical protein
LFDTKLAWWPRGTAKGYVQRVGMDFDEVLLRWIILSQCAC